MPFFDLYRLVKDAARDQRNALQPNRSKLANRLIDVFLRTWDLGFTAFGGPPVHFKIIYERFVGGKGGKTPWIDEQTYQELFAICQGLPGPGSTKMLFCVVFIHAGFLPALFVFLTWSLPGAIGMFALAIRSLNAATVGIIALAAVQLAERTIKDRLSRGLIIFGACAGLCYTALWYFPVLMVIGALVEENTALENIQSPVASEQATAGSSAAENVKKPRESVRDDTSEVFNCPSTVITHAAQEQKACGSTSNRHNIPLQLGIIIIVVFFLTFIAIMVARSIVHPALQPLGLFANMYLAGTIIFGGGPVVIPLLREYVVQPGWVDARSKPFQAQTSTSPSNPCIYSIFVPGITLAVGVQSIWRKLRGHKAVTSVLRGVNAAAVGLVFTAVYWLWEIGYLTKDNPASFSLGKETFWLVVAALTYAESAWFDIPPWAAIGMGAVLGLCWYGAVGR
ncbi:hypothetical protein BT63DRAFT_454173 [Microthyrium microscopicum]|uniref:Chromate ion transporter n=1 Tax=Microthyrium microscopicum TaxID=703497 RepID=A0A6A6UCM0_9PEZI|nr:hypothetical protein BT63DRAFT_454173 [Microthyrium microscopicum]